MPRSLADPSLGALLLLGTACASLPPLAPLATPERPATAAYASQANYFGYVVPGSEPDEVEGHRQLHYLYLRVPATVPELALRLVSPVRGWLQPRPDTDQVAPGFADHAASLVGFDADLALQRCAQPAPSEPDCLSWHTVAHNDDSDELPTNDRGAHLHAQLRAQPPAGPWPAGIYRLVLSAGKGGDVQGTYLVQVGAPVVGLKMVIGPDLIGQKAQVR